MPKHNSADKQIFIFIILGFTKLFLSRNSIVLPKLY